MGWVIAARPLEDCDNVGQNRKTQRVQSDTQLLGETGNYTEDPPPNPCRLTGLCLPHSQLILLSSDGWYNRAEYMGHRNLGHVARLPCLVSCAFPG